MPCGRQYAFCAEKEGESLNQYTYEGDNQKLIERFMLFVFTVQSLVMIVVCAKQQEAVYSVLFMLAAIFTCWMIYIAKAGSYEVRAFINVSVMLVSICIYAGILKDIDRILPMFMTFIVLIGVYGFEKLIYLATIATVFLYGYFGFILKTFSFAVPEERTKIIFQLVNVLFMQYLVYSWTERNAGGSRQLLKVIDELKEVQSSKDDFLANVSHEIRTPINTICGMSELVLKEELPLNIKNNVRDIDLAGRNLMSVVRDILDFSELQSEQMELEEEAYNITSTINDIINMALARRQGKRIEIIVDCAPDIPCLLLGDEKKLRRIIMNVVDNAIKFTNAGCVFIGIQFRKESYGINLIVTIRDTGIGMTQENLENIFTSFNQVNSRRNRLQGGLGLGMAITGALINKMNGAITIKSKPEKGTTVCFTIPQKVLKEDPIVSVRDKGKLNIATYIDMEQFAMVEIRDEYAGVMESMAGKLNEKHHMCRSIGELQRRAEKEKFTHIFTSIQEYNANTDYFDAMAEHTNVVIILDDRDEKYVTNPKLLKVYKPFYILSIVSVLNGLYDTKDERHAVSGGKFVIEGAHVLAVDDNLTNLRVIEGLLEDYHIKVTCANSGADALEKITSADYDFVFMDHMMPEMDGVETMQQIRDMPGKYYKEVPIVALTADAVAGTREMLLEKGFSDFLEKPVERSVLERILKRNISGEKFTFLNEEMQEKQGDTLQNGEKTETADCMEKLRQAGLDVEKGSRYCNGPDKLIQIIRGFLEDYDVLSKQMDMLFEGKNWKDYTIAVHAVKGSMASIGATKVSELAKQLELAGKGNHIGYIMEHHAEMQEEYKKLFFALKDCLGMEEEPKETVIEEELPEIEEARLNSMLEELEAAAYELQSEQMLRILEELEQYSYQGVRMKESFSQVRRKVEQFDCISASELAVRLKHNLERKEE